MLLEEAPDRREVLHADLAALADGDEATEIAADAVRRALVALLGHGDRPSVCRELDAALLGGAGVALHHLA